MLSDLISTREHYDRYDLGDDRAIEVSVRSGANPYAYFHRKEDSTFRHTYVRTCRPPGVFLAEGALPDEFGKSLEELMSREIFSEAKNTINSIEIRYGAVDPYSGKKSRRQTGEDGQEEGPSVGIRGSASAAPGPVDANEAARSRARSRPFTAAPILQLTGRNWGRPDVR